MTITVFNSEKIADHKMSEVEIKNYATENEIEELIGFDYLTKFDDGSFEQISLNEELKPFHYSDVLFDWQEKMFA